MSYPPIYRISDILLNEAECINFLIEKCVFYYAWNCHACFKPMKYYKNRQRFRCTTKNCGGQLLIRKNTFFDNHRLPVHKILHIGYLWLKGDSINSIAGTTGHTHKQVSKFLGHYRNLVAESLEFEDNKIG